MRLFIVDSLRTLAMLLFLLHFQMQNGQHQPIDGNAESAAECLSSWVMFIASSQSTAKTHCSGIHIHGIAANTSTTTAAAILGKTITT